MGNVKVISIAKEFSEEPYGRYPTHGDRSGELLREKFLIPGLVEFDRVRVDLSGTFGYGSSFLEEAFGGLVRIGYFRKEDLYERLEIVPPASHDARRSWGFITKSRFGADKAHKDQMDQKYRS